MADKYAVATGDWSVAGTWAATTGGAPGDGKPGAGDDVYFDAASGAITVTMDEDSAAVARLDMATFPITGTLAMGTWDIPSTGYVTLGGTVSGSAGAVITTGDYLTIQSGMTLSTDIAWAMNAITGSQGINSNGVTIGALTINDSGGDATFTLQSALTCGAIVITDGAFSTGNFALTCTTISGAGGEIAFGTSTVIAGANIITLDSIAATVGAATITATNIDLGAGGTLTMSDTLTIDGGFLLDGGTLTMATNKMSVSGSWINASGTLATPGTVEMTGTGDITTGFGTSPDRLELTSTARVTAVTSMLVRNGFKGAEESVFNIGAVAVRLCDVATDATDIVESLGTFTRTTGSIVLLISRDTSNSPVMDLGDIPVTLYSAGPDDRTWTQSGRYESGDLWAYHSSATWTTTLNLTGNSVIGDIILGFTSADKSAAIDFNSGVHTIGSITMGHDANENNEIIFDASSVNATGTIDATGITVTNTSARIFGGTVSNVDNSASPAIYAHNSTDGGGNSNVIFLNKSWYQNANITTEHKLLLVGGI